MDALVHGFRAGASAALGMLLWCLGFVVVFYVGLWLVPLLLLAIL